ncbi:hypothetical protein [Dongia sedimenti]|uniref:Uncharacterized protein n=1 Tax=Dongia sedimenti TaxID=3064282 RepID=A0ABU0YG16_9PROT|nr:hypothetical protein [Rhodospirillaceae bacterium R-7]
MRVKSWWKLLIITPLTALLLIALRIGILVVYSFKDALSAQRDFCKELDRALACRDSKESCLVIYHQTVTEKLARAKTTMEFHDSLYTLENLDSMYQAGRDLLASDLRETDLRDFEKQRHDLVYACSSYP